MERQTDRKNGKADRETDSRRESRQAGRIRKGQEKKKQEEKKTGWERERLETATRDRDRQI